MLLIIINRSLLPILLLILLKTGSRILVIGHSFSHLLLHLNDSLWVEQTIGEIQYVFALQEKTHETALIRFYEMMHLHRISSEVIVIRSFFQAFYALLVLCLDMRS